MNMPVESFHFLHNMQALIQCVYLGVVIAATGPEQNLLTAPRFLVMLPACLWNGSRVFRCAQWASHALQSASNRIQVEMPKADA